MILFDLLFIVLGFILLIKGADYFVEGAVAVAVQLGIPEIIVGLTIVAFGTSAPEAAVSIQSALTGVNGIAIGNVLGSNIMNIMVILGLTSLIVTLHIKEDTIRVDIPFLILISVLFPILGFYFHSINRIVGFVFWGLLIIYLVYLIQKAIRTDVKEEEDHKKLSAFMILLFIIGGIVAIILGSHFAVDGAKGIAKLFGVSDRIIGLTIVALGTSLPELMTSLTAAKKGNADIAIGNIVGSNIFNVLFILGTTSLIKPIPFGMEYFLDSTLALLAVVLLFVFAYRKKALEKKHGIIFLGIYLCYLVKLMIA